MSTGFQQTHNLWQAIIDEKDATARRFMMVEMAKLLLDFASMSESDIRAFDTDKLVDFFMEYNDTSAKVFAFYQSALPCLQSEYEGTEFDLKTKGIQSQLSHIIERSSAIITSINELELQKELLIKESEKLKTLEADAEKLQVIYEKLKPDNLSALFDKIEKPLTLIAETKQTERQQYEKHLSANIELTKTITGSLSSHAERLLALSEQISKNLKDYDTELREIVKQREEVVKQIRRLNMTG